MNTISQSDNTEANITAIEEQIKGETDLEACILWVLDDARGNTNAYRIARDAAAELAAQQEALEAAKVALKKIAKMDGPSFSQAFGRCVDTARAALAKIEQVTR